MTNFDDTAIAALERSGYKPRTPDELVKWWANLIEQCEDGYEWTIYEFDDEMSVRDYLDVLINDESVQGLPEFSDFRNRVEQLDARYRLLLQDGVKRPFKRDDWWRTGVLKFAGDDYCEDMESRYSIAVEVQDDE